MDYTRVAERPLSEDTINEWKKKLQEAKGKGASRTESINLIDQLGNLYYRFSGVSDNGDFDKVFIYTIKNYDELEKGWSVPEEKKCEGFYSIDAETAKHKKIRIVCNTVTKFTNVYILS